MKALELTPAQLKELLQGTDKHSAVGVRFLMKQGNVINESVIKEIADTYIKLDFLGQGGFADVWKPMTDFLSEDIVYVFPKIERYESVIS